MASTNLNNLKTSILNQLASRGGAHVDWLQPFEELRKAAVSQFEKEGFPPVRHEEWKYSPLSAFINEHLSLPSSVQESKGYSHIQPYVNRFPNAMHLILENGSFFLTGCIHDAGISVNALSVAATLYPELIKKHYGKIANLPTQPLAALNTAVATDGAMIYIPKNSNSQVPVFIHHVTDALSQEVLSNNRALIIAEAGSSGQIVELFHTLGGEQLSNTVTEIFVGENASLEHYVLHTEAHDERHVGHVFIKQAAHSRLHTFNLSTEGKFIRNNLQIEILGSGAENYMWGLYLLHEDMHVDNHTAVDHQVPHANSNEHYKGILTGNATGVFNGKIFVREGAQKTNAFQSNNNLLLSKESTINTKPQLEIFADDVKCSHGATIGQLQEDALFYLRCRGLDESQAKKLLVRAFAEEIVEKVSHEELKTWLEERIDQWFEKYID